MSKCKRCGLCCMDCGDMAYHKGPDTGRCPALEFEGKIAICKVQHDKPDVCREYPFPDIDNGKCFRELKKAGVTC